MNTLPKWLIPTGIIAFIFVIVCMFFYGLFAGNYNKLIAQREQARTEYANIETQMQRRADLVPNIVGATKGAMKQEKAVFDSISKAYASYQNAPSGSTEKLDAGTALGGALRGYLVVVQQYPNLKSLDLVKDLTVTLEGTENRISVARQRYNESVQIYNQNMQSFPTNMIANMFGFQQMQRFQAAANANTAPQVDFGQ